MLRYLTYSTSDLICDSGSRPKLALWVVMATALGSALDYFWRVGRAMKDVGSTADDFTAAAEKRERHRPGAA